MGEEKPGNREKKGVFVVNQDTELDAFKQEIDMRQFAVSLAMRWTGVRAGGEVRCCGAAPTRSSSSATVLAFHKHPIRAGWRQVGKRQRNNRAADPWPEDLTHRAEAQILPPLQEIDDGSVVVVISHREENIMAIAVLQRSVAPEARPHPIQPGCVPRPNGNGSTCGFRAVSDEIRVTR
jgi:hypothetical protein